MFLPQRGRMSAKLTGEGEGRKSGNVGRNGAWQTFSLITLQCTHWRVLPPLGEAQTVDKVGFCHREPVTDVCIFAEGKKRCGDP